jgi:hypothetical protein
MVDSMYGLRLVDGHIGKGNTKSQAELHTILNRDLLTSWRTLFDSDYGLHK